MTQGTFAQALRKEAALSGTFMKGRSLMLNGAVLSIEDSGSRFSKNVTVEGSVCGSRGDLYKTHVALDMDEHEVIDYDCDCPAAYRYPGMCKHAIATALAYLDTSGIEPVEGLRTPVRTFTAQPKQPARAASAAPAVNPNFPFPAPVPTSPSLVAALSDLSDARMDELASMRRKLAGAVDPDAPKAALEPRWCRTTIRCSLTALAGRSSSAFAVDRSPTWSRTSTAWPMPTCAAARSPMARSSRLSIHLRPLTKHRQSCSTLL